MLWVFFFHTLRKRINYNCIIKKIIVEVSIFIIITIIMLIIITYMLVIIILNIIAAKNNYNL